MLEEMSKNSEVEKGVIILKGDIQHLVTNKSFNYNQTVVSNKNKVLFFGNDTLYFGKLYNWFDYIYDL